MMEEKQGALTEELIQSIIKHCEYKDWQFVVFKKGDGFLIQPQFVTGREEVQKGRKWYVSRWSTISELINTMYFAVRTAELHEISENFKYQGEAIYHQRKSVSDLLSFTQQAEPDKRKDFRGASIYDC